MARSVSMTRTPQRAANQSFQQTVAATGTEMASTIFVLRRSPADPTRPGGAVVDRFDHVASPAELEALPISAPLAGQSTWRVASFAKTYATQDDADDHWDALLEEVGALVRALNQADNLGDPETVVVTG